MRSPVFHTPIFYRFGEVLLQKVYNMHVELHKVLKPYYRGCMTKEVGKF